MTVTTPNYNIDYEDQRFKDIEKGKQDSLNVVNATYGAMINNSDQFYQSQIDASKEWADKQSQLQQEQTDFALDQINQQKEQAAKDYAKEQSGAYVDWQKQSNAYGANAEAMAAQGLAGSGYSESSQVSMYNTYQNRVATARESYNKIVMNYDNAFREAQLQNNVALGEIAYNAMQQQLELALSGFQYKNTLLQAQLSAQQSVENNYYNRYMDVLQQINNENSLAEQVRQYNAKLDFESEQARLDREHDFAVLAEKAKNDQAYANLFQMPPEDPVTSGMTPKQAIEILNTNGAGRYVAKMLSEDEWKKQGKAMTYSSYSDYLLGFVQDTLATMKPPVTKPNTTPAEPTKTYDIVEQEKEKDPATNRSYTSLNETRASRLSDSGKTINVTYTEKGKEKTIKTKLYKDPDGKLWFLNPETNRYMRYT